MSAGCVAITGGTGFIGSYLVQSLTAAGWHVRLLVRPGPRPALAAAVEVVNGDLNDPCALSRLLDGADALVHAAGAIKARSRRAFLDTNRDGARHLAEMAKQSPHPPRVVMVSSLAAREPHLSDYAFSKAAGEQAFRDHGPDDLAILRPAAVYGPGDRETAAWLRAAWGPALPIPHLPAARVCLIHAADVAAAVTALCAPGAPGGTFELSDHRTDGYGWRELAETARAAAAGRGHIVAIPPVVLRTIAGIGAFLGRLNGRVVMLTPGKAREILHPDWSSHPTRQPPSSLWRPVWTLRDGLAKTFGTLRMTAPAADPT